jgi:hypothetical protein
MLLLGGYWCTTAYQAWMDQPVLTTITTTALPVDQVQTLTTNLRSHKMYAFFIVFEYFRQRAYLTDVILPTLLRKIFENVAMTIGNKVCFLRVGKISVLKK